MRAHADAAYLHLIVNEGPDAGASLEHSHAQLYALGFVPAEIARERERATAYHERTMGSHLLGDVATEEVRRRERLVAVDDEALLVCPWASRSPFELRVIPRRPQPRFEDDEGGAAMIATALRALAGALGALPQLNLWVRTAPRGAEEFCWHIDIVPRLTVRAGFELGTGVEINVYPPERAAADLREALGAEPCRAASLPGDSDHEQGGSGCRSSRRWRSSRRPRAARRFGCRTRSCSRSSSPGEEIQTKLGSMVAYQGDVRFEHAGSGGLSRMIKKAVTNEGTELMKVTRDRRGLPRRHRPGDPAADARRREDHRQRPARARVRGRDRLGHQARRGRIGRARGRPLQHGALGDAAPSPWSPTGPRC